MPKLPIIANPYFNVDESVTLQGGAELIDGWIDETGALNRRPGLWPWWTSGEDVGCDGLFWWKEKQRLLVVSGGRVYAFTSPTTTPVEISDVDHRLLIGNKVSFASSGNMLFMANGNKIFRWDGAAALITTEDSEFLPGNVAFVSYLSGRVLAAELGTSNIYLTEGILAGDTMVTWKPTFFRPDSAPDSVSVMGTGWSEVLLGGSQSVEFWYFTGVEASVSDVPFAPVDGATVTRGILAPNSLIQAASAWFWLDSERKVIRLDGRTPKIISIPVDRLIRSIDKVDDAIGFWYDHFYILSFPSSKLTLVYDILTDGWCKWAKWNTDLGQYERFLGQNCVYVPEWNYWLMAGHKEGRVYIIHPSLQTDCYEPIRMLYRSAHFDHGTMQRKLSKKLFIRLKRGNSALPVEE